MSSEITLKHADLTEKIIGVFYDVYNELGYGFLESVYEESLVVAFQQAGLAARRLIFEKFRENPWKSVAEVSA